MTENEAIKILEEHTQYFISPNDADALYTVLDIIQQYREIGTVEECKTAMDLQKHLEEADNNLYKILLRCSEYEQIGTVEECREGVEKQKQKKIIIKDWNSTKCPTCNHELSTSLGNGYYKHPTFLERCPNCGQAIRWEESEEE